MIRTSKILTIFVPRASECLTDHESHGDGLICFSLLNGLAERGHQIYAYADLALVRQCSPNLHLKTGRHRSWANSPAPWELAWRADRWLQSVQRARNIDLVWRMHPYGIGCPTVPQTGGKPLVVGPLFYEWPAPPASSLKSGRPRLGIGLQRVTKPFAVRGWQQTLDQAALIFCATGNHAETVQRQQPQSQVHVLPVIVDPPPCLPPRTQSAKRLTLLFAANLVAGKNPLLFCHIVQILRASGVDVVGMVLGEGPERAALEAFSTANGLTDFLCIRGKVPNPDVYRALGDADFLVSTSDGEPYGRSIAEAMSVGTPAICHRSGGPVDFISDGIDGLLVDTLTAEAYAARLQAVLSEPGTWGRLSAAASQKAQAWRSDVVLDTLETQLQQAAENGRKAA